MKKARKFLTNFLIILLAGATIFVAGRKVAEDLGIIDSSALFGGDLERGYPSAGYLISYEPSGGFKTCGYSVLNNRIAISASHCVDNSERIELGKGDFNLNPSANINVIKAVQKEGWVGGKSRRDDFSILIFNDTNGFYQNFAEIAPPLEGCNYRVVAYGRTENDTGALKRPRKSAVVCISEIDRDIFKIKGANSRSGICFGDSGSPIYSNETNQVVGIVASIVLEKPSSEDPCDFGNTAIAVRTDTNQRLINENIQALDVSGLNEVQVANAIILEVTSESLLDQLGLGNLTTEQQLQLTLLVTVSLGLFFLVILLVILLRRPQKHYVPEQVYYYPPPVGN